MNFNKIKAKLKRISLSLSEIHQLENKLIQASADKNFEKVKSLIENGADVNAYKGIALAYSAREGNLEEVKYLHEMGASLNIDKGLAFIYAVDNKHVDVIKYFIDNGINIEIRDNYALKKAAKGNDLKLIELLLHAGVDSKMLFNEMNENKHFNSQKINDLRKSFNSKENINKPMA